MTHESFVVSLVILELSVHRILLASVLEMVPYGWTMCDAVVLKVPLQNVFTEDGKYITVVTVKMHQ